MKLTEIAYPFPIGSTRKETLEATIAKPLSSIELVQDTESDSEFFRSLEANDIYLNEQQLHAVRSTNGPQLILAGAGSGKTRVLTARTSYILTYDKSVQANEILLITFSKKAATEMRERMKKMPQLTAETVDSIVCGTFHSIFLGFLRERGYKQEILASKAYRQVIMKRILRKLKLEDLYQVESVYAAISDWKNRLIDVPSIVPTNRTEKELKKAYLAYEDWKRENEYIDFEDILVEMHANIVHDGAFQQELQQKFKYLCLDEYQDVNLVQHEIIKSITTEESNVFFVGDEDQLVYSFRNSSPKFILGLAEDYPSIQQLLLTVNYRSKKTIIGAANKVISFNTSRVGKVCEAVNGEEEPIAYICPNDSQQEAVTLVDHLQGEYEKGNRSLGDFTFLYRTHSYSRALIDELAYREIPFVVYGNEQLFYDNNVVRPLVSHLRLLLTQDDVEAIADIAPTCYVKRDDAYQNAIDFAMQEPDKPAIQSLLQLPISSFQKGQLVNRLSLLNLAKGKSPVEAIKLFRKAFYDNFFETKERDIITMQKEYIQETLNEFESSAKRFDTVQDFIQFIDGITNSYNHMKDLRTEENPEAVKLMTIHQSKGLEFPVVFLIGASDSILPHASSFNAEKHKDRTSNMTAAEALEEERRLLYVAMTRAEEELTISSPKALYEKEASVCRFLLEAYA